MSALGLNAALSSRLAEKHELPMSTVCGVTGYIQCPHNHELLETAVFFQSLGVLKCNRCGGYQAIKKPLK